MSKTYFQSLDVYRGLAITAVVLNHLPLHLLTAFLPDPALILLSLLTGNGKTGVTALFLLSGFLIAWIYPQISSFLQFIFFRLLRLMPPFLTMVMSLTIIRGWGRFPVIVELLLVIGFALISFLTLRWFSHLKSPKPAPLSKFAFFWLMLQLFTALFYLFYVQHIPAAVFYQTWSDSAIALFTGLVNATLTLPFGQYVGQLDGVYWSLPTEYLFYLLYPAIVLPVLKLFNRLRSVYFSWLFAALFCYGLGWLAESWYSFGSLNLSLMISFITGAMIGSRLSWWQSFLHTSRRPWLYYLSLLLVILTPILPFKSISLIFISLPLAIIVVHLTQTILSFPGFRCLVFIGRISYSLYLTHSIMIDWLGRSFMPTNWLELTIFTLFAFGLSLALAFILYWLTEKPYSWFKKPLLSPTKPIPPKTQFKPLHLFTFGLLILLYLGNRPPLSLFTSTLRHRLLPPTPYSLSSTPLTLKFSAAVDNFGMLTLHLTHRVDYQSIQPDEASTPSSVRISLYQSPNTLVTQKIVAAHELYNSPYHPLGFPLIVNSKNQEYWLTLQSLYPKPGETVVLDTSSQTFISVYFPDKKQLLSHPGQLLSWFIGKISEPFTSSRFWMQTLFFLPLIILITYLRFIHPKNHSTTEINSLK